ncbi:hypothetical protein SDRG_03760 [Saprolegnia diclina VS20]|uniref:Calpain catalytic domain-containing protein n=1 Tax=Saprolegnia diclina (strain VS20) TaxID=1156394 RepID=T0QVU2_SAPDV|nr:hypothetical protein SDRG_03760 [Saprolegnia diclina VS20]EQC38801.1 hypothetical protein SDRG_03760 [Saprolegnia diclina VS20]|eukprot:XP_008607625.1 hypothetical protein SDRG_03760 [Saprolegnia diclina VS20]
MSFACCCAGKLEADATFDDAAKPYARGPSPQVTRGVAIVPTPLNARSKPSFFKPRAREWNLDAAIASCKAQVAAIAAECYAANRHFRDAAFDVSGSEDDCLSSLAEAWDRVTPGGSLRVRNIFTSPVFCDNGYDASDIQDGYASWFLAAVASACAMPGLLARVCVARDETVGVYGFIFFKDGEWVPVLIDDQLFVTETDFDHAYLGGIAMTKETFNATLRSGSSSLSFAKAASPNETWLPLLEKAYAKLHGDYKSIEVGLTGEALEDLTGGITTRTFLKDVADHDALWQCDLVGHLHVDALFAASIETKHSYPEMASSNGLLHLHPYAVLRAVEVGGHRLVQLRNPQKGHEWTGDWSDSSELWTTEMIDALGHSGGDDGCFWMAWTDFLDEFTHLERTWIDDAATSLAVHPSPWVVLRAGWPAAWQPSVFTFDGPDVLSRVTLVLQQADTRRCIGLEGSYTFGLRCAVYRSPDAKTKKRVLVGQYTQNAFHRSASLQVVLRPGLYELDVMVVRTASGRASIADVVAEIGASRPEKLRQRCEAVDASRARAKSDVNVLAMAAATQHTAYERARATGSTDDDGSLEGSVVVGLRLLSKAV